MATGHFDQQTGQWVGDDPNAVLMEQRARRANGGQLDANDELASSAGRTGSMTGYGGTDVGHVSNAYSRGSPGRSSAYGLADNTQLPGTANYNAFEWGGRRGAAAEDINRYRGLADAAQGRGPNYDAMGGSYNDLGLQARNSQQDALGMYRNAAMGLGPSAAQSQFQQGLDASGRQAMSMAAGARGGPMARAAAMRMGMQQSAGMNQMGAAQAAQLRAQEQQAAMQGYAGLGSQIRTGDMNAQQGYTSAGLQQRGANDAMTQFYEGRGWDTSANAMKGAMGRQDAISRNIALDMGKETPKDTTMQDIGQGVGTAAMVAAMAMSDRRVKKDIQPADGKVKEFLDGLTASDYKYKDEKHGQGRHTSVMAQDLEKSELGRRLVSETKDGKMVNYTRGLATMMAAQAHLNKRLNALEGLPASKGKSR